jgi:SAM-dependent methyltransferase
MKLRSLIRWPVEKLQEVLAGVPKKKGIKFLIQIQMRLDSFILQTIKNSERKENSIHPKHAITDFHSFFIDNIRAEDSVLEVGCSYGQVSNALAMRAREVTGLDIRKEAIEKANNNFHRDNLFFICSDFMEFIPGKGFDVIVLSNILEHVEARQNFLKKAGSLGKRLLIRVPAYDRDWMVPYKKSLGLEWRVSLDHKIEYTDKNLREEIHMAGLKIESLFCRWGNYCCIAVP